VKFEQSPLKRIFKVIFFGLLSSQKMSCKKNKDCCCSEKRLIGGSGVDALDIQDDHPRDHVDDSTSDDKGIKGHVTDFGKSVHVPDFNAYSIKFC